MQFMGSKGIAVFVLIVLCAVGVGFGTGLLVGRQYPAHRFEKFGDSKYLLDPTTGKVCDPFKDPSISSNPFDHAFDAATLPKDANGLPIIPSAYPPPCGK